MKYSAIGFFIIMLGLMGCGGDADAPATSVPSASLQFNNATALAGLGDFQHHNGAFGQVWFPEIMGSGAGVLDYNGDGWPDLLLLGGGAWPQSTVQNVRAIWLYRNNGDGTFSLATDEAGLADVTAYGFGITVADYDNDGDTDFFMTTLTEDLLFQNNGDGTFVEVAANAGVAGTEVWTTSALFFDADQDGWVDLYVGRYVDWSPEKDLWCTNNGTDKTYCTPQTYEGIAGVFYRNLGDGTFAEETDLRGLNASPGKTLGVAELDFNTDGWPDLVVANDTQPDLLFQNNGDGTFTEVGLMSGLAFDERGRARAGMGIAVGDVDQTGAETVFVGNFSNEMIGVYRYVDNGLFLDRAAASRIGRPSLLTLTFGLTLFDADLDGDLDVLAANGHVQPDIEVKQENVRFRQPPHLFVNQGDGTFNDAAATIGSVGTAPLLARAVFHMDYDRDGDMDVLFTENDGPIHLWRNETSDAPNALQLRLEGTSGNPDALGAMVRIVVNGVSQFRRVRSADGYLSQSEQVLTFGLGAASQVDSLIITWPGGSQAEWTDLPARQRLTIREGAGLVAQEAFQ